MHRFLGNSQYIQSFEKFPKFYKCTTPKLLQESGKFWEFPNRLGIWEISQIPGYLGSFSDSQNSRWNLLVVYMKYFRNFPNTWVYGKFPKCLGFWEIPQIFSHLRNFQNLNNIPPANSYGNLGIFGNFPNAWVSKKISQMPGYLENFPNAI